MPLHMGEREENRGKCSTQRFHDFGGKMTIYDEWCHKSWYYGVDDKTVYMGL